MAYHLYNTEAIVCGSRDSNTSDRAYMLFTREAGMIWAQTKSVREERSKHRYALQDFSVIRVSLIQGKAGWRIVGTEPIENLYYDAAERGRRIMLRNSIRLLRRVIRGEEATPILYDVVAEALRYHAADIEYVTIETILSLRILAQLGYVASDTVLEPLLEGDIRAAYDASNESSLRHAKKRIEGALTASHL